MQIAARTLAVLFTCSASAFAAACSFPDYTIVPVDPLASICSDGLPSAAETGVDCGGGCPPCGMGQTCRTYQDCVSLSCVSGMCQMPTCSDGVKNAFEADVDCGGQCDACAPGHDCKENADCAEGVCADDFCQRPACDDGALNGAETGPDCGGGCANTCDIGSGCNEDRECASHHCSEHECVAPGCTDSLLNGQETDLDCGGQECGACGGGEHCTADDDCMSHICQQSACTIFSCEDGVLNGQEASIDCGGANCKGCGELEHCGAGSDCDSGVCLKSVCVPSMPSGVALSREGWLAGASDTYPDHDPNQVLDSVGGRWTSGKPQANNMAFEVDMGQVQTFFSIVIRCDEAPDDRPGKFNVYLSNDRNYGEPALPIQYGTEGSTAISFDAAQLARHFKIVLRESKTKWWSINEINVLK